MNSPSHMSSTFREPTRGSTLIELLVAITLAGGAALVVASSYRLLSRYETNRLQQVENSYKKERILDIVGKAVAEANAFWGSANLSVSSTESFRSIMGNEFISLMTDSSVITVRGLNPADVLRAAKSDIGETQRSNDRSKNELSFCGKIAVSADQSLADFSLFLGISVDGTWLFSGEIGLLKQSSISCNANLYRLQIDETPRRPIDQIFPPKTFFNKKGISAERQRLRALIPVKRLYSIFVDSKGVLRMKSHQTAFNQPVASQLGKFAAHWPTPTQLNISFSLADDAEEYQYSWSIPYDEFAALNLAQ